MHEMARMSYCFHWMFGDNAGGKSAIGIAMLHDSAELVDVSIIYYLDFPVVIWM
jgi:hypothetical protein